MARGYRTPTKKRIRVPKLGKGISMNTLVRLFGGTVHGAVMKPGMIIKKGGFTLRQRKGVTMTPKSPKPKLRKLGRR